jgi:Pvc16 N-terminal domain
MPWSTPDLSDITQVLLDIVQDALNKSPLGLNITLTAQSPETARDADSCRLTLYLLHVGRDPYWRNTPVSGPRPQLNSAQPLSLSLSYLLSAWHKDDFVSEQRAMSIALQAIPLIQVNDIAAEPGWIVTVS